MKAYYICIEKEWSAEDDNLFRMVSETRKKKVMFYRYEKDRKLSLYAELLMKMLLSRHEHQPHNHYTLDTLPSGKPVLREQKNLHISLSHTKMCVAVCLSDIAEVGIDVEKIDTAPISMLKDCFHPEEIKYLFEKDAVLLHERFYEIWTRKEAILKQIGCGLVEHMNQFNTLNVDSGSFTLWKDSGYQFSCYSQATETAEYQKITETELIRFFIAINEQI